MDYLSGLRTFLAESEQPPSQDELTQAFQSYLRKRPSKAQVDSLAKRLLREAKAFRDNTVALNKILSDDDAVEILNNLAGRKRNRAYWMSGSISIPMLDSGIHQLRQAATVPQKLLGIARLVLMIGDHEGRSDPGTIYPYLMRVADWGPTKREAWTATLQELSAEVVLRLAREVVRLPDDHDRGNLFRAQHSAPPRPKGW